MNEYVQQWAPPVYRSSRISGSAPPSRLRRTNRPAGRRVGQSPQPTRVSSKVDEWTAAADDLQPRVFDDSGAALVGELCGHWTAAYLLPDGVVCERGTRPREHTEGEREENPLHFPAWLHGQ